MAAAYDGSLEATINTELLQEVLHIYQKRNRLDFAVDLFDRLLRRFPDPLPVLGSTMITARQILGRHPQLESRDSVHSAVVLENRLEGIISADRSFDAIDGVQRFDPLELGKSW